MSWSGFKKNVGRATTQVMMKTGHVEKTSDRSYDVEERRYRTLESASLRLQKEAKGYLDSLRAMTASQMRIAETIDAFYGDSGAKDGVSRSYKQAVEDLDAETVKALDGPYRCVPSSLYKFCGDDDEVVKEVEAEWNFRGENRRVYTRGMEGLEEQCELMDFIYRTTVLEPINRFCAYFPDINECIKKRNHKMLDYDAMRAKVKKLTEKPDKDPAKLPRTEKETEMVGPQHYVPNNLLLLPRTTTRNFKDTPTCVMDDDIVEPDLSIPSPPKALQRPEIQNLKQAEAQRPGIGSMALEDSQSYISRAAGIRSATFCGAAPEGRILQQSPTRGTRSFTMGSETSYLSSEDGSVTSINGFLLQSPSCHTCRTARMPAPPSSTSVTSTLNSVNRKDPSNVKTRSMAASSSSLARSSTRPRLPVATPFFQPSELEELMAPFKQEFVQRQADIYVQAKAAYEQLNEQLTTELPQLIDLRVPYLDPSFEALVKIQLRFCAEAYSRMAQVQQYLDASTRDQYASGDLDARVEDVLGQIRELSIAGTV